jgi:hypothetical protein
LDWPRRKVKTAGYGVLSPKAWTLSVSVTLCQCLFAFILSTIEIVRLPSSAVYWIPINARGNRLLVRFDVAGMAHCLSALRVHGVDQARREIVTWTVYFKGCLEPVAPIAFGSRSQSSGITCVCDKLRQGKFLAVGVRAVGADGGGPCGEEICSSDLPFEDGARSIILACHIHGFCHAVGGCILETFDVGNVYVIVN